MPSGDSKTDNFVTWVKGLLSKEYGLQASNTASNFEEVLGEHLRQEDVKRVFIWNENNSSTLRCELAPPSPPAGEVSLSSSAFPSHIFYGAIIFFLFLPSRKMGTFIHLLRSYS